jgi:uncharacterized membrane protein
VSYKLLVLSFESQRAAGAALHELQRMEAAGRLALVDSVLVTCGLDRDLEIQPVSPQAGGRWPAGYCRVRLAPLLSGSALPGRVARTTVESLALSLRGNGVDDAFIDKLVRLLQPGSAALFLLGVAHETDRVLRKAESYGAKVLQTTLLLE